MKRIIAAIEEKFEQHESNIAFKDYQINDLKKPLEEARKEIEELKLLQI